MALPAEHMQAGALFETTDLPPDYSTAVYPYDAVAYITDNFPGLSSGIRGSGVIIGPHTILTASHVLWDSSYGAAYNISVYPAYNNGGSAITGQYVTHFFEVSDDPTISQQQSQFDYAIIDFATDLSGFGWFGILTDYAGGMVHATGYPASAGFVQTDTIGSVYQDPGYAVLDYGTLSTSPGNSGGPIWYDAGGAGNPLPYVVGIVSTGSWGVQLTGADLQQIQSWEAADSYLWSTPSTHATANDFNGDRKSDLLFQAPDGRVTTWDMSDHTYSGYTFGPGPVSSNWQMQKTGDFNGDGKADIVWRDSSGEVATWTMNDHQYSGFDFGHVDLSWQIVATGDLNNDGKSDILWRNTNGQLASWDMSGQSHTGVDLGNVDASWKVAGVGDFDKSGSSDILWRDASGELAVWYMNSNNTHTGFDFGKVDNTFQVVGVGDFSGDGNADILWRNVTTGDLISWDVGANGSHVGFDFGVVDPSFVVADVGDYNGDGISDILWRNTSTGNVVTWDMNDHIHTGFDFGAVSQAFHLLA
ncbi:hypothetical protein BSN85_34995 [Bradyrhizobium brasilense]|uniref:FG-GAP-like repeat-containing protein n=1 Tax=Bradyrhizobium brasilense TaxID=1419277 RepID=UPI000977EA93|nr:FG-GAP-like repeat-containing protein [Bradyrhizobium brasilense]OMI00276.1 hypothetical protein BSN85_34995 [Bradyrhizobium brasilense]